MADNSPPRAASSGSSDDVPKAAPAKVAGKEDDANSEKKEFVKSTGLTTAEADALLAEWGRNELEDKRTSKFVMLLKQFIQPMPIMIWIAIIVMGAIEQWADFGILLLIQFINAFLGWYEQCKAGDAVAALKASLKPQATVNRDGKWQTIDAALLVPGDMVLLGAGAAVPADCLVNDGQIQVDQSALTGESLPVTVYEGGSCKMGSTVTRGEVEGTVEFTGKHTFFGKTATMLQMDEGLGNLQKILLKVMVVLLIISFTFCGAAFTYLMAMGESFKESLSFTVVLLVASIPIAIEIVCTTTLAIGSRKLSQQGAIVTRLPAIEEMAGMNMLCSDKTGTLTLNKMVIQDDCPTYLSGMDRASVLKHAALAAKWREPPKDALDTMVLGAADLESIDAWECIDHMPFDPTIKRTESTVKDPSGKVIRVTKGAPNIILDLVHNKAELATTVDAKITELGTRGVRALAVARSMTGVDEEPHWELLGVLTFLDPPRPDTKYTIEKSLEFGVDVKMITGDHLLIAKETARVLGMGTNILGCENLPSMGADGKVDKDMHKTYGDLILGADGFAQVYPEHKFLIVEVLRQMGFGTGMTGDGVNDAPALKRADVGVAVAGATDAARAAADIVLTQPGLSVMVDAIVIARCIFQRVYNFFNYRIAATMQLLVFFFLAVIILHPTSYDPPALSNTEDFVQPEDYNNWADQHFFKMPVLLLMLITLLNDGTLISIAYDHVIPSARPEKWNLRVLFTISIVLGAVACASSILLLWLCLNSNTKGGVFDSLGIPGLTYGQLIMAIYLKVSVSDFLTLFSARAKTFFFLSRPSPLLLAGAGFALLLSTLLACFWPKGELDHLPIEGLTLRDYKVYVIWVWLYCIVWLFVQDICKVATYHILWKFNIFGANTSKFVNMRNAHDFGGPNAVAAAGVVEVKALERQAENAQEELARQAKVTGNAALARASADVGLMRQSVGQLARTSLARASIARQSVARQSVTRQSAGAIEEGALDDAGRLADRIQQARDEAGNDLTPEQKHALDEHIERIRRTSAALGDIGNALERTSVLPPITDSKQH